MKRISRAQLRGEPLLSMCRKARTTTHEYGMRDNRVFCMGLIDGMTDDVEEKCLDCKAYVFNAEPPKEDEE